MIAVRRRWIRLVVCGLACLLVVAWRTIGQAHTPHTAGGYPLLYTPGLRAVDRYRLDVGNWASQMSALQDLTTDLLNQPLGDPYALSETVDVLLVEASQLVQIVQAVSPPASLTGLRELVEEAALAHQVAAEAAGRWAAAPTAANTGFTTEALNAAQDALDRLITSPWLDLTPTGKELLESDNSREVLDTPWGARQ